MAELIKPNAGETNTVVLSSQESVLLPTEAQDALVRLDGDTLYIRFLDDSELVLENIAEVNFIDFGDGNAIPTEVFLAALEVSEDDVKAAAGADGSGGSHQYYDDMGDVLAGINKYGPQDPDPFATALTEGPLANSELLVETIELPTDPDVPLPPIDPPVDPPDDPDDPLPDPDEPAGDGNKGHGNNTDGQDDDNPGQGGGGPNQEPKDGEDEDEGNPGNQGDDTPGVGNNDNETPGGDGTDDEDEGPDGDPEEPEPPVDEDPDDPSDEEDPEEDPDSDPDSDDDSDDPPDDPEGPGDDDDNDTPDGDGDPGDDSDTPNPPGLDNGNKGHGNNWDGQDDDNPGQGGGGPNSQPNDPKDGEDEDEGARGNQDDDTPGASVNSLNMGDLLDDGNGDIPGLDGPGNSDFGHSRGGGPGEVPPPHNPLNDFDPGTGNPDDFAT